MSKEYSAFSKMKMFISGNQAGTNTTDSNRDNANVVGSVYVGYDCNTNKLYVTPYLLNVLENENCEIQKSNDEAWTKFTYVENGKTTKVDKSTPGTYFEYLHDSTESVYAESISYILL